MLENFHPIAFLCSPAGLQAIAGFIVAGIIAAGLNAIASAYWMAYRESEGDGRARLFYLSFAFQTAAAFVSFVLSFLLWGTPFAIGLLIFACGYRVIEEIFF